MKKARANLLLATSPREAWENAIAPWFEKVLPQLWRSELPALVLVPTRGHANALKAQLLAQGSSHLGLQFATPHALRELRARDEKTPTRTAPEHLRLFLALAAAETPNDLTAKAVARSPGALLHALDRLAGAGWEFEQLALPSFAPLVRRFRQFMQKTGFSLPGEIDRLRFQGMTPHDPKFSNLLITGFDGAHWRDWFLLRTAVAQSENATVVLTEPRDFSETELCWIGSWEEILGEAKPVASRRRADTLFTEEEMRGDAEATATRFDFLVGLNISEQAEAIARQCLRYLAEEQCTRLGVIFPGGGALPRLVAGALARLEIPHNDGVAHVVPGIFESTKWQAWLELQRAPRLDLSLIHI